LLPDDEAVTVADIWLDTAELRPACSMAMTDGCVMCEVFTIECP
jgi:hypothetical protein